MTQNNNQKSDDPGVSFETPVADAPVVPVNDPNIISPTFRKNGVGGASQKLRTDAKVQPVIMRSFQQDLSEAIRRDKEKKELRQSNKIQGEEKPFFIEPNIPKSIKIPLPTPAAKAGTSNVVGGVQVVVPIKNGNDDLSIEKGMVFVEKKPKPFAISPSDVTFHAQTKVEPVSSQNKEFKQTESEWIAKPGAAPIPVQVVGGPTPVVERPQQPPQPPQPQIVVQNIELKVDSKELRGQLDTTEIKIPGFYHKPASVPSSTMVQSSPTVQPQPQPQQTAKSQPADQVFISADLLKEVSKAQQISLASKKEPEQALIQKSIPPAPIQKAVVDEIARMPTAPVPGFKKEEPVKTELPKTANPKIENSAVASLSTVVSLPAKLPSSPSIPAAPTPVAKPAAPSSSLPPAPNAPLTQIISETQKSSISPKISALPPAPVFVSKKEEPVKTQSQKPVAMSPAAVHTSVVKPVFEKKPVLEEVKKTEYQKNTVNPQAVKPAPQVAHLQTFQSVKKDVTQPFKKTPAQHFVPVGFHNGESKPAVVEKKIEHIVEKPTVKPLVKPFVRPVDKPVAKQFIKPIEKHEVKPIEKLEVRSIEKTEIKPLERPVVAAPIQKQERSHLPSIAEIHQEIKSIQEKATVQKSKIEIYITAEDLKTLKDEVVRMDAEIKTFSAQLQSALGKRTKILEEKNAVQDEFRKIQEVLSIVERKEEEIKNIIRALENEEEAATTADQRHEIEEKRWKEEDNRAGIEKKKWEVNVLYEKNNETIRDKKADLARTEQSIEEFNKRITALIKQRDEKKIKIRLGDIEAKKKEIEDIQVSLLEEKHRLNVLLTSLEKKEEDLLKKRKLAEDLKNKQQGNIAESRAYEMSRHEIEKHLREAEQKRWESEKALEKIAEKIAKSNEHYDTVMKIKDEVQAKLSEYILEE